SLRLVYSREASGCSTGRQGGKNAASWTFYISRAEIRSGWGRRFRLPAGAGPRPKRGRSDEAGSDRILFDIVDDSLELSAIAYPVIIGFILPETLARASQE